MSDLIDTLKRKTSLRSELKNASAAEIEKVISNLNDLLAERAEEEARQAAELEAKRDAIEKIKAAMLAAGLSVDDLEGVEAPVAKSKTKAAAKYAINVDGERHEWTGRGRTPKVFADYMTAHGVGKEQLPAA